jgi:hypothetical protein
VNTSRRSVFSTHRGKAVRRVILIVGSLAMVLFIVSAVTGGTKASSAAPTATATATEAAVGPVAKDPEVLPAVANPKTKAQQDQMGVGIERDPSTNRSIVKIRTQGDNDNTAATQVAQKVAVAWGTYSHTSSAQEFVSSLPNVAPGAEVSILNAVKGPWAQIQARKVDSSSKLTGVTPIVQVLNEKLGVATVSVKVEQSRSGEVETGAKTVTFVVQMSRFEVSREIPPANADPSKPVVSNTAWGVIGVRQQ